MICSWPKNAVLLNKAKVVLSINEGMDRVMFYSGSLTAPSQKRLKIQVAPEKSDVVFDLALGERTDTAVCAQQQREQKAAVFTEIIVYYRRLGMKEGENELLIKGLWRKKTVQQRLCSERVQPLTNKAKRIHHKLYGA